MAQRKAFGWLDVARGAWKISRAEKASHRMSKKSSRKNGAKNPFSATAMLALRVAKAASTAIEKAARATARAAANTPRAIASVPGLAWWGLGLYVASALIFCVFSLSFISADDPLLAFDGAQSDSVPQAEKEAWREAKIDLKSPKMQLLNLRAQLSESSQLSTPLSPEIVEKCLARGQCVWFSAGQWETAEWIAFHRLPSGAAERWSVSQRDRLAKTGGYWGGFYVVVAMLAFGVLSLLPFIRLGDCFDAINEAGRNQALRMARWLALGHCVALFVSCSVGFAFLAGVLCATIGQDGQDDMLCPSSYEVRAQGAAPESMVWAISNGATCSAWFKGERERAGKDPHAQGKKAAWEPIALPQNSSWREALALVVGAQWAAWEPMDNLPKDMQPVARQSRDLKLLILRFKLLSLGVWFAAAFFWVAESPFDSAEERLVEKVERWGLAGRMDIERKAMLAAAEIGRASGAEVHKEAAAQPKPPRRL